MSNNSEITRKCTSLNNENTIHDRSENSFKMLIEPHEKYHKLRKQIKKSPVNEGTKHSNLSMISRIGSKDENDDSQFRNYRIDSFNSVQGFGEQLSEPDQDHIYLKYPREKLNVANNSKLVMLEKKLSATTSFEYANDSSNYDIENQNLDQPLVLTHNNLDSNNFHSYFETPNRLVRVTSLEVNLP